MAPFERYKRSNVRKFLKVWMVWTKVGE